MGYRGFIGMLAVAGLVTAVAVQAQTVVEPFPSQQGYGGRQVWSGQPYGGGYSQGYDNRAVRTQPYNSPYDQRFQGQ